MARIYECPKCHERVVFKWCEDIDDHKLVRESEYLRIKACADHYPRLVKALEYAIEFMKGTHNILKEGGDVDELTDKDFQENMEILNTHIAKARALKGAESDERN